jgi:D-tyrosyl-tRNA(Tyr) deacylase
MRIVLQRVSGASLSIDGKIHSEIGKGLMILLGIEDADEQVDADYLATKIHGLRIFNDADGKMNLSHTDINGDLMVVSQFTLYASTAKGNRPSFIKAARPERAIRLYEYFIQKQQDLTGKDIRTGVFGADMQIALVNDGPVTIVMDSKARE